MEHLHRTFGIVKLLAVGGVVPHESLKARLFLPRLGQLLAQCGHLLLRVGSLVGINLPCGSGLARLEPELHGVYESHLLPCPQCLPLFGRESDEAAVLFG